MHTLVNRRALVAVPDYLNKTMDGDVSLLNEPLLPDNVGVIVPGQRRSLHSLIAQSLKDVEGLLARLELGVTVAAPGRALVRELYVGCRRQRLRLELE